jgi:hypothetical protein
LNQENSNAAQNVQTPRKIQEVRQENPQDINTPKLLGPETIGLLSKEQHQNPPVGINAQLPHKPITILPDQVNKIEEK